MPVLQGDAGLSHKYIASFACRVNQGFFMNRFFSCRQNLDIALTLSGCLLGIGKK